MGADTAFLFSLYHKIAGSARGCETNHAEGVYIIRNLLRYIIKPQENARWRVMRYKGGEPPLMKYATLRAAMICQACGLDKKIPRTKFSEFFGGADRNRTDE